MSTRRLIQLLVALTFSALSPRLSVAQQVDVIRGRVIGPDSAPVPNTQVVVTSIQGNVNRTGKTDRNGRYSITFPNGDGNYIVTMSAIGFAVKRFEIRRVADEDFLLGDAKLSVVGAVLDAVNVTATRDKVSRNANDIADISGTDRAVNTAGLPPDMMGDLAAMAATLPGMQLAQDGGFSAFGLGGDQNNTTLNGLNTGLGGLPRDAQTGVSVGTSLWDVSRGGFGGAQTSVRTRSGTNFLQRKLSSTLDAPALQWTDRIGSSLGNEYSNISPGGFVSGPLIFDKAFYNVSYQLGRRSNPLQTLLNTSPAALQAAGVSADSVARLTTLLGSSQIPSLYSGLPDSRLGYSGSLLGSFDFTPPSSTRGSAWNATVYGSWGKQNPNTDFGQSSTRSLPTALGERTNWNGGIQARQSSYFGFGILTETSIGFNASSMQTTPYVDLPGGRVRVNSIFDDGSSGVQMLTFGGNTSAGTQSSSTLQGMNMLSWFSANNKHRLKLTSELRLESNTEDQTNNRLGTYTYNSLGDLQTGVPAVFTRQLLPRERDASQVVGAVSLGDSYRRTPNFQLQYGLRVDANRFLDAPARNPALEEAFGIRNDHVPNSVLFSPRVGFSWTYGTGTQIAAFNGAFRGPRAVLRGGVGIFQNQPTTSLIGRAVDNTGLPTGIQQLVCIGPAVPMPHWNQFGTDASSIPDRCADGSTGTGFASGTPNVVSFAKNYVSPRSLRSNVSWNGPVLNGRYMIGLDGTYSLNMQQSGFVDRNFSGVQQFTIGSEGNRQVYATPDLIVPNTGSIAANQARINPDFARVTELRSDLTSMSRQVTARLNPISFNANLNWGLSYTYANVREQFTGFNSTAGDPGSREWSRSGFDSRHQVIYNLGYNVKDFVRINWFGQLRSGSPYTPMVAGDINGDGSANDRAFIYDPASTTGALSSGMQALLSSGSAAARKCLAAQLGQIASRNSCEGPWTQSASLNFSFNPLKVHMPQRATLSFNVQNPLGAADLLMHGEDKLHGWGQQPFADQSLLYVRGFDPAAKEFKYEVNQRFGATNPSLNTQRNPVILTASLSIDIGPPRERQLLTQSLDRGRRHSGDKTSAPILKSQFGTGGIPNVLATILRDQDTLKLSTVQADSLATMNRRYLVRLDSIWAPVSRWLAELPTDYNQDEAYTRYRKAREATIDMMIHYAPAVKKLLSSEQYSRLPSYVASALDPRYLKSIRSSTVSGGNAFGGGMAMGGGGGTFVTSGSIGGGGPVIMR